MHHGVEAYAYRQGDPDGDAKDECTESFNGMIQIIEGQVKEYGTETPGSDDSLPAEVFKGRLPREN